MTEALAHRVTEAVVAAVVPTQIYTTVVAAPSIVADTDAGSLAHTMTTAEVGAHIFTAIVSNVHIVASAGAVGQVAQTRGVGAVVGACSQVTSRSSVGVVTKTNTRVDITDAVSMAIVRTVGYLARLGMPRVGTVAPAPILSISKAVAVG